jgi:hypothetical protein
MQQGFNNLGNCVTEITEDMALRLLKKRDDLCEGCTLNRASYCFLRYAKRQVIFGLMTIFGRNPSSLQAMIGTLGLCC